MIPLNKANLSKCLDNLHILYTKKKKKSCLRHLFSDKVQVNPIREVTNAF